MLACNLPLQPLPSSPIIPPTLGAPTEAPDLPDPVSIDLVPTATLRPEGPQPTPITTSEPTIPLPTETPTPLSEPVLPTFTPVLAPTATPRAAPVAPPTPEGGPLDLGFTINWRIDPNDVTLSIAAVELIATGGDGNYTFFRDNVPTGSAVFEYYWGRCQDNPGSFRVDSGDAQSLTIEYFQTAACE